MKERAPYQNPDLPIENRVDDLLARMSLEEKVGQMCQYLLPKEDVDDSSARYSEASRRSIPDLIEQGLIGSILNETDPERLDRVQRMALSSRLGIPMIFGIDAIHGNGLHPGATVFPAPIGLAATWDLDLVERVAQATAREMRAFNLHWTFSPNVDVALDGRWGRVGETFGEDPYLVGEMGAAMVRGYQGDLSDPENHALACAKHFIAGGEPPNGRNFAAMDLSERRLREVFLPPFKRAAEEGVGTFMAAHNEVNGVPCHASCKLLTEILKEEWAFEGFVISDWTDVARLATQHRIVETVEEADRITVEAGLDMHMHGPGFLEPVCKLVREGALDEARIDDAVRRILTAKFTLGLFEQPLADASEEKQASMTVEHSPLALEAARKSIVLLKNEADLLPLDDVDSILVTGPDSDNQSILGDWTFEQPAENVVTILDGIRQQAGATTDVRSYDCGSLLSIGDREIAEAARQAASAEVAVVAVGENPLRYSDTKTEGENVARTDLALPGRQLELVQAIQRTGTPTVVVLVNGRPLALPWIAEHVPAVIEAFHPGMMGGRAVAEVLFGQVNPSGRLPYTIPHSVGQQRMTYRHRPSDRFRDYVLDPNEPLFPFGHGLSYTTFEISGLQLPEEVKIGEDVELAFTITNTGDRTGDEVVLICLNDVVSSVTTPVKQLAQFQRVHLEPGTSKRVHVTIEAEKLALLDANLSPIIEPGTFELFVNDAVATFEVVK